MATVAVAMLASSACDDFEALLGVTMTEDSVTILVPQCSDGDRVREVWVAEDGTELWRVSSRSGEQQFEFTIGGSPPDQYTETTPLGSPLVSGITYEAHYRLAGSGRDWWDEFTVDELRPDLVRTAFDEFTAPGWEEYVREEACQ